MTFTCQGLSRAEVEFVPERLRTICILFSAATIRNLPTTLLDPPARGATATMVASMNLT